MQLGSIQFRSYDEVFCKLMVVLVALLGVTARMPKNRISVTETVALSFSEAAAEKVKRYQTRESL